MFAEENVQHAVKNDATEVLTFSELKKALEEDNGITDIKVSGDIVLSSGIVVNKNKENVSIDMQGNTLVEKDSSSIGDTINLPQDSTTKKVSLKNAIIQGKNYYGPIGIRDSLSGVTLKFENIQYTGPQMIYNQKGFANFSGTNKINVKNVNASSPVQEFAQVGGVTISGEFDLTHEKIHFQPLASTVGILVCLTWWLIMTLK